jgi:5-methylcytosine-specific restriction endonuclease McrA
MFKSSLSARAHQVLSETDHIVVTERKVTVHLLKNLREIEENKFYLELGFSSIYDYCTNHLKYPEAAAVRRIRTARCLAEYPELLPLLESGEVNSTTVAAVSKHITRDNAEAVIDAIKGKSSREVERFIAALQPLSTIPPDRSRPVVVPVTDCVKFTIGADGKKPSSVDESTPVIALSDAGGDVSVVTRRDVPQFKRMVRSEFTAEEETMQKLDRVRSLASHRLPMNAPLAQLIDFMADYFLEREDPIQRHERRTARAERQVTGKALVQSNHPRHIPAAVRDQVFVRDQRCTYVGPDGKRCNSSHVLQVDHIVPVARRGAAVIDNLRLLCAEHNRLEWAKLKGKRDLIRETSPRYMMGVPREQG